MMSSDIKRRSATTTTPPQAREQVELAKLINTIPDEVQLHSRVAKVYDDRRKMAAGEIPGDLPIFLDSPMAREATEITLEYKRLLRVSPGELSRLREGAKRQSVVKLTTKNSAVAFARALTRSPPCALAGSK